MKFLSAVTSRRAIVCSHVLPTRGGCYLLGTPAMSMAMRFASSGDATSSSSSGKRPIKLHVTHDTAFGSTKHEIEAPAGMTLMEALRDVGKLDMEAACDGTCACSTCHVVLDERSYRQVNPATPTEDELDMLDLAPSLAQYSRLSCQVVLNDDMDELTVKIPNDSL